eukprot:6272585-Amphidinium_carterae.2
MLKVATLLSSLFALVMHQSNVILTGCCGPLREKLHSCFQCDLSSSRLLAATSEASQLYKQ